MGTQQNKQEYHSPRVKTVDFKVEDGYASINFDLGAVPFYSRVANIIAKTKSTIIKNKKYENQAGSRSRPLLV